MTLLALKILFHKTLCDLYPKEEIDRFYHLSVAHFTGLQRINIVLHQAKELGAQESLLLATLEQLQQEVPLQYILGETEFYGLPFKLNDSVLIPRPETEELVHWVIERSKTIPTEGKLDILDIGTGSGCIAITLAKKLQNAHVSAIDVSDDALKVAQSNAELNGTNVQFFNQNILTLTSLERILGNKEKAAFDMIVSNPPYVRKLEQVEINNNVLLYEPHLALFVENEDPLLFYDRIANLAKNALSKNGLLFFEINQYLGKETSDLLMSKGFHSIELRKDIFGNDRMLKAQLH